MIIIPLIIHFIYLSMMKIIRKDEVSLIEQMRDGQFATVRCILCCTKKKDGFRGFDVVYHANETDLEGLSALENAIIYGLEDVALMLMQEPECSFLYSHKDGNRPCPAGLAIKYGRNEVFADMLKRQSFDAKDLRHFVQSRAYGDISLLCYAVMYKNLDAVHMLKIHGAKVEKDNEGGFSTLSQAAIQAVGCMDCGVEMQIFREVLKALAGQSDKHEIIAQAVADLHEASLKMDDPKAIGKVDMILASADMY